jgi:chromosome segregation protein
MTKFDLDQIEELAAKLPALEAARAEAQAKANEQRGFVAPLQAAISLLNADRRSMDKSLSGLEERRERLERDLRTARQAEARNAVALAQAEADCASVAADPKLEHSLSSFQIVRRMYAQLAERARVNVETPLAEIPRINDQIRELQERKVAADGRFEELDLQLAESQCRHSELDDRVTDAERRLSVTREHLRRLERQAQEEQFAFRAQEAARLEKVRTQTSKDK